MVVLWLEASLTGEPRRDMEMVPISKRLCLGRMEGRSIRHLLLALRLPVLPPVRLVSWLSLAGVLRRLRLGLVMLGLSSVSVYRSSSTCREDQPSSSGVNCDELGEAISHQKVPLVSH